jgi:hypothetical protein
MTPSSKSRTAILTLLICAFAFCLSAIGASAQQQPATPQTPPPSVSNLAQTYSGFEGDWVGQLQYRDFSSDSRVFLPTWLRISRTADGRSLQFEYTYDDGPTKTVKETSLITIDPAAGTFTVTSDRDHSSDAYKLAGLSEFSAKGRGSLTLSGTGIENDKPVDVRITITVARNLYTYQKETRLSGADFLFRDAYTFTRKDPPR